MVRKICANCGRRSRAFKKCAGCDTTYYCGAECQRAHREQHRHNCGAAVRGLPRMTGVQAAAGHDLGADYMQAQWRAALTDMRARADMERLGITDRRQLPPTCVICGDTEEELVRAAGNVMCATCFRIQRNM